MKPSELGDKRATRQCWECLKRRLVCDYTLPHCKKCQKAGRECSGYDDQKPIRWVEPGKTTSRRRKKESPPNTCTTEAKHVTTCITERSMREKEPQPVLCTVAVSASSTLDADQHLDLFQDPIADDLYERNSAVEDVYVYMSRVQEVDRLFSEGGRQRIEEVIKKGLEEQASRMVGTEESPLKRLERVLRFLLQNDLPRYDYLSNETSEIVQAVNYCKQPIPSARRDCVLTNFNRQRTNVPCNDRLWKACAKPCHHTVPNQGITCASTSHPPHTRMPITESLYS